jgi:hypothetical protein
MKKIIITSIIAGSFSISSFALAQEATTVNTNNYSESKSEVKSESENTNHNYNDTKVDSKSHNTNINQSTSTSISTNNNNNVNSGHTTSENTNINSNTNINQTNSTNTNTNNNINTGDMTNRNINESNVRQKIEQPPPTAIAPAMMSGGNNDLCTTGVSGAVQTQIFGLSFGSTVTDKNCERLKLSKTLYDMGMKVAAVATMCQDRRVWDAMWNAGTPCPYEGKIGEQARELWLANPGRIPREDQPTAETVR